MGISKVTIPAYLLGEFENHFRMTREMCQLLTQEIKHTGRIHLGGPQFCQKNKYCSFFGVWQTRNRIVRSPTLGRETKPHIFCEWNTKFSIIPEIPSKRVHSKRIPKFSKLYPEFLPFHSISDRKSRNFWSNGKRPIFQNVPRR